MKKSICFVLMIISSLITVAQDTTFTETELSIDEFTDGTITIPAEGNMKHLIIFIQGSYQQIEMGTSLCCRTMA